MEVKLPKGFLKQVDTAILLGDRWMAHRIWINDRFLLSRLRDYDEKKWIQIWDMVDMAKESL